MTGNEAWGPLNGYTKWFLGFSLYVSNTTYRTDWILCFKDTAFNTSTIPSVFNTTCFERGKFVIYHNERLQGIVYPDDYSSSAYNDLCEVEVFGCPTSGYYGTNCSIPCPEHCLTHCHIEKGTCQACKPGYQGQRCEQVCPNGTYGINCKWTCGQCANFLPCSRFDGTCNAGCSPGYFGRLCNKGELFSDIIFMVMLNWLVLLSQ
uniref:Multiple epidermal growth factor-like domains protein 10 n=1 Tax=Crassostrea virginica TaxID=6565 RepID=A0A8B8BYP1_CRAVI|nr:multiple epidermal growth factor-like domains protein 10 [Crassostrea virginica]